MDNVRIRTVQVEVKGKIIEYEEYYMVDLNGEEIFDRNIEIENDKRLYNIYKKQNNLLTNEQIKKIRKKYNLTQKDYALIIGVGEITVHRFEKGAIQTEAVDSIMRLSDNPDNMFMLFLQNKDNIGEELRKNLQDRIMELKKLKKHKIANISDFDLNVLDFQEESAMDIAKNIVNIYNSKVDELVKNYKIIPEYITNLKLQKLLYYVQSLCLLIFNKKAFPEKILAWNYGPVVNEVYQKYKSNHSKEIKSYYEAKELSDGVYKVIEEVVESYGSMEANKLIDFTHEEDPWKNTPINKEIDINSIKEYFNNVYND